jgi:hypothetical protein
MADSQKHWIELDFSAGLINGVSMSLQIDTDQQTVILDQLNPTQTVRCCISVPGKLSIQTSGKGDLDTQVDDEGNIIADKYIQLTDMRLDGLSVDENYLPRFIMLKPLDKEPVFSNYWGFNGTVEIQLSPTPFQWLAGTKRL